jgi:hypothetical protein
MASEAFGGGGDIGMADGQCGMSVWSVHVDSLCGVPQF